jgi:hypothetical protein
VLEGIPRFGITEVAMAEDGGSKVVYFLAGLALGAFMGFVVIAPKSGEETREYLAKRADEGRDFARRKAIELRERADRLLERSRERDSHTAREAYIEEVFEGAGPHEPGGPEPDDDEPQSRKVNLD